MAASKLNNEIRTFIVQAVACFDSPSTVVKAVREEFGVEISKQTIEGYDPTKRAGRDLAARWRTIFEETRKAFLEDTVTIGISHRAVRLRALQRMAEKAESQGNMVLASSLMEQAASLNQLVNNFTFKPVSHAPAVVRSKGGPSSHAPSSFRSGPAVAAADENNWQSF